MRGTPVRAQCGENRAGIIPAYAGNTYVVVGGGRNDEDHPRVCGEHLTGSPYFDMVQGSSPRMRGTLDGPRFERHFHGIIPAYAGNTTRWYRAYVTCWDHPRVCGEHCELWREAPSAWGSSPRMRGTHA